MASAMPVVYEYTYTAQIGMSSPYTRQLIVDALTHPTQRYRNWTIEMSTPTAAVAAAEAEQFTFGGVAAHVPATATATAPAAKPQATAPIKSTLAPARPIAGPTGSRYNMATAAAEIAAITRAQAAGASAGASSGSGSGPRTINHVHVIVDWREFEDIDWSVVVAGTPKFTDKPPAATRDSKHGESEASASGDRHRYIEYTICAAFPVRKGLIRKAQLSYNVSKWTAKHPNSVLATSVPESIPFEIYDPEYIDEALCDLPEIKNMSQSGKDDIWVLKASMINQAKAVHIFNSVAKFTQILTEYSDVRQWVAQRYIDRPFLISGKKFHLRAYVLAVGSLRVYLYDSVLALFAAEKYDRNALDNIGSHITNTCVQTDRSDFDESVSVRSLAELNGQNGLDVAKTLSSMIEILRDTFAAVHSEPTVFLPLHNTFELYGVDFLLDQTGRVYLLEVNAGPDFAQTGTRLQQLCAGVLADTVRLAIDPFADDVQREAATAHERSTAAATATKPAAATAAPAPASDRDSKTETKTAPPIATPAATTTAESGPAADGIGRGNRMGNCCTIDWSIRPHTPSGDAVHAYKAESSDNHKPRRSVSDNTKPKPKTTASGGGGGDDSIQPFSADGAGAEPAAASAAVSKRIKPTSPTIQSSQAPASMPGGISDSPPSTKKKPLVRPFIMHGL